MKKDIVEYLGFDDEEVKNKVGRPKLADKKTKKKSLIIAGLSFFAVVMLLAFGYGTLFGFRNLNLTGSVVKNKVNEEVLITDIKPIIKDVGLKVGTARKLYLTVLPANATNKDIEYQSSNTSVAIVDDYGKVTALKEGKTKITAKTTDGTEKTAVFNIKVVKNASGKCEISSLNKNAGAVTYQISCDNAKIKEVQYKVDGDDYLSLLSKKSTGEINLSSEQLQKKITLKVVYYPNNSKVSKYEIRSINNETTTKNVSGSCDLDIKEVSINSAKYSVSCNNASPTKIAYKIGDGSYVGLEVSNLADTVLFEESDITRIIYFSVEYKIDGTDKINTVTKNSVIQKKVISE